LTPGSKKGDLFFLHNGKVIFMVQAFSSLVIVCCVTHFIVRKFYKLQATRCMPKAKAVKREAKGE
jgi:6-phosphogluconolactonase (cycloisomerase 2 family)